MKILRIKATGLPLYEDAFDVHFLARQRVQENHLDSVTELADHIYVNNIEAFIGINASGKSTALKVISFAGVLLNGLPMNAEYVPHILPEGKTAVIEIDYFQNAFVYHLRSELIRKVTSEGSGRTIFLSEKIWRKQINSKTNKTNLLDFGGAEIFRDRENAGDYLPDDVSIMIALNRQNNDSTAFVDLSLITNYNFLFRDNTSVPTEIISLLDPSIESIAVEKIKGKTVTRLKFYGEEPLVLIDQWEISLYLSSGTIKGIRVFTDAIQVLKNGGYLIVDEIENHFNYELVASLLRLFMDKRTNPNGAVLVFSTHYSEILDELERNDSIFVTRKNKGLRIDNLNLLLKRNDLKKSEVYQSNLLGGTAPKYSALMNLKKSIISDLEA